MTAAARSTGRVRLAYAALFLLFCVSLTYRLRDTADRLDELLHGDRLAELPFDVDFPELAVSGTRPESDAAGVRIGDVIVGVDGAPLAAASALFRRLRDARPGDRLAVEVESAAADGPGARRRSVSIVLQPMRQQPPGPADWGAFAIVNVAMPYLCLALGFWVAAVRIHDRLAWLLLLVLLSLGGLAGDNWRTLFGRTDGFQPIAVAYQPLLATLWPTAMMLFGIYFPERLPFDRRMPWAKWIVIAPVLVHALASVVVLELFLFERAGAALAMDEALGLSRALWGIPQLAALLVFFAAMARKTLTATSADGRRRLLLLASSAAIGIAPVLAVVALIISGMTPPAWIMVPIYVPLFLFPLAMAYVIVVRRAMDVRVVIRQGLQYVLARGSVRAMQIALSIVIVAAAATAGAGSSVAVRVLLTAGGLAAVLLIQTWTDRLRHWVDRRFFRDAYDAEQILSDLASRVRTMVETQPLLETVARQISRTMHVPRVAVHLAGDGVLEPAYAVGDSPIPAVRVRANGLTDEAMREVQQALGAELLLPLSAHHELIGVMSLGPKQSEEPYSKSDRRLLDSIAAQTGLALANSRLTAEVAAAAAQREKARRELEIAREVQERLFPQECPPVAGIDYAGTCRPALGVGGDYYDFIRVGDGQLGLAIGDVSGKGIPAALLMATLRAYLRGQTIRGESDLAAMIATLNELVFESSASNRYATFFYGQYDAASRVLRYVNAGHNPPMVFRPGSSDLLRLDRGGPVIGLMEGCSYVQGCVALEPGDVLVAFTDGISEAMNAGDEEWGEERLVKAVQPVCTLPAIELTHHILGGAAAFAGAAPQHDDMTVVVLRVTG